MNINFSKIIREKNLHNYSSMATDNVINFSNNLDRLLTESSEIVTRYMPDICKNPLSGSFIKYHIMSENLTDTDMDTILENLAPDNLYAPSIKQVTEYKKSNKWLLNDTLYQLACNRYSSTCLYESSYVNELNMVGYNINTSPEAIDRYVKLLTRIEIDDYHKVEQCFPQLLKTNTNMILSLRVKLSGQVANYMVSLPTIIAKRLIAEGTRKQKREFIKILNTSITDTINCVNSGDPIHYNIHMAYLDSLESAKSALEDSLSSTVNESAIYEHIAQMMPDVVMYEEGIIEDPISELDETIATIMFDDSEEISMESVIKLTRLAHQINHEYEVVEEVSKVHGAVRKTLSNAAVKSEKTASKLRSSQNETGQTVKAAKKVVDPFVRSVSAFIDKLKDMDNKERRERIITNEFRFKLIKTLKQIIRTLVIGKVGLAVAAGGAVLTGGAITIIGILGSLAIDKAMDDKVRRSLTKELEEELAVVNEKLDDAKSGDSREKKYELIRIKKKLEAELDRVKYRTKSS